MADLEKNIMYNFTREDHRSRLKNIRLVEKNLKNAKKKELITDYIQGHYVWPKIRFDDFEADEERIKFLAQQGVGLIQIWEHVADYVDKTDKTAMNPHQGEWMFRPYDKEKASRFIELVHKYNMKIIPYTSTNFYLRASDSFKESWAMPKRCDLCQVLAHCSPNSPGWREHIIRQYATLLDEYNFDGIYNDAGYIRTSDYWEHIPYYNEEVSLVEDEVLAFEESAELDGGMQDLLALIYGEVKKRGGIVKFHREGFDRIRSKMKLYDYLWVGECVESIDLIRKRTKFYDPYVVPDFNFKLKEEHERYLNAIPYMQFPLLRSEQGEGSNWGGVPDFELQLKWLKLYKEMTACGTWAYIDIELPKVIRPLGEETVITAYVNTDIYVVAANYSYCECKALLGYRCTEVTPDGLGQSFSDELTLAPREMKVLKLELPEVDETGEFKLFNADNLLGENQLLNQK